MDAPPIGEPRDPVAERIRSTRQASGLTLRQLAGRASARLAAGGGTAAAPRRSRAARAPSPTVSASYLSLIESGRRVPDEAIAVAIAEALGEDGALFAAWVRARKRTDLSSALEAAERLKSLLAATTAGILVRPARAPRADDAPRSFARLRIPVIAEGSDPGEGVRPTCVVLGWRRLDVGRLDADDQARLDRPFALRLTEAGTRRVRGLLNSGADALVLRGALPPQAGVPYLVRVGAGTVVSRVLWNGRHLLLLPAEGENDFGILEAANATRLRALVLGAVMMVDFEPEEGA